MTRKRIVDGREVVISAEEKAAMTAADMAEMVSRTKALEVIAAKEEIPTLDDFMLVVADVLKIDLKKVKGDADKIRHSKKS